MLVERVRLLCVGEYSVFVCEGLMCFWLVDVFVIESHEKIPKFVCVGAEINSV